MKSIILILSLFLFVLLGSCDNKYHPPEDSFNLLQPDEGVDNPSEIGDSTNGNDTSQKETLKEKAQFDIGCAVNINYLDDEWTDIYTQTIKANFSRITFENAMKNKAIWFGVNDYKFGYPDRMRDFAVENGLKIHGHVLLWPNHLPSWITNGHYDSAGFESLVKGYIHKVVTRYKADVGSWDVVNELFEKNGKLREDNLVFEIYKDPIAFVGRCFQYARDADPDAKLFYNDFQIANLKAKREAVIAMVNRFKEEGYPIDGIGLQSHLKTPEIKVSDYVKGMKEIASTTGLLIHISELDVRLNSRQSPNYVYNISEQERQSDYYNAVVAGYEELPQNQKFGITTWGVSDRRSWLRLEYEKAYPLLFDDNFEKKPAYFGFLEALK